MSEKVEGETRKQRCCCSSNSDIMHSTSNCHYFSEQIFPFPLQPSHLSATDTFQRHTRQHTDTPLSKERVAALGAASADLRLSNEQLAPPLILLILPHCDSHRALSTEALWTARHDLNRPAARCRGPLCKQIQISEWPIKKRPCKNEADLIVEQVLWQHCSELYSHQECLPNSSSLFSPKFTPSVFLPRTILQALLLCVYLAVCSCVKKKLKTKHN